MRHRSGYVDDSRDRFFTFDLRKAQILCAAFEATLPDSVLAYVPVCSTEKGAIHE